MNAHVHSLLDRIYALERELATRMHDQGEPVRYRLKGQGVDFDESVLADHRRHKVPVWAWLIRSRPQNLLSLPVIYAMAFPLMVLDVAITGYQAICFPLYGMEKVARHEFFVYDQHQLGYLNAIEKLHCTYCSYASGLLAYTREITARTEQYWCPIKHSREAPGAHGRYPHFLDYGDPTDFQVRSDALRRDIAPGSHAG